MPRPNKKSPGILKRPRRLRATDTIRRLVRETAVEVEDLILPLFVSEKVRQKAPVASMPGVFQFTVKEAAAEAAAAEKEGIRSVLLFGIPARKDERASGAYAKDGVVQKAVRAIKKAAPKIAVITDVCLCEYMSHGHCGITEFEGGHARVLNDESLALLAKTAVSHAAAGADIVAPSDMMDGRVRAIRSALDEAGHKETIILSYAAKFASAFYGPFRDAAESAPKAGDRKTYQMDAANALEALREVALDIEESADIVMVKPGLPYLDVLWRVKERFGMPTAVYNVSGEYAMIKAAAQNGWLDERATVLELTTAFKRAGADLIVTYWARDIARWLKE
ncbi:MAG TPA: porphobilinogen synthase [Chthoniobacteraceae bacterium]|nr:porphobilinogen synthase [Chthoniobacteraceae bacterium]